MFSEFNKQKKNLVTALEEMRVENNELDQTLSSLEANINYHKVSSEIVNNDNEITRHTDLVKYFEELLIEFNELKSRVENFDKIINKIEKDLDAIDKQKIISDNDKRRMIGFLWLKKSFIKNKEIKLKEIYKIKRHLDNDPIFTAN